MEQEIITGNVLKDKVKKITLGIIVICVILIILSVILILTGNSSKELKNAQREIKNIEQRLEKKTAEYEKAAKEYNAILDGSAKNKGAQLEMKSQSNRKLYKEKTDLEEDLENKKEELKKLESSQEFKNKEKNEKYYIILLSLVVVIAIISLFYFYISKMVVTVTNTRVYGKKAFGKRVDLPIDTISAVGTSFLKGIDIGTSAGKIKFKGISNNNEIHAEISKLLNTRQSNKKVDNQEQIKENNISNTEELKKYKELLDTGVITQEEFDTKKKQLLNL